MSKDYGPTRVVSELDLAIRDGEFMVLVGPSGCGKSTALRMLAGLEEISSGTISIGGHVVNDLPPRERDIAMVFQSYALYPHMSVRENLGFGIRMRGIPRDQGRTAVERTAETLGITQLLDRRPGQLSGGQRQRVAVGRAIVRNPAVFLFDEPLSNLDAKLRGEMRAELIRLQQTLGTTSVYVTHDQIEAMTMAHRIAVLREGRLQQLGTPAEVYDRPVNVFVASFIGTPTINLLAGDIEGDRITGPAIQIEGIRVRADVERVIVGIRPEHLIISSARSTAAIRGEVDLIEPLGHETLIHLRNGNDRIVAASRERVNLRIGDSIAFDVQLEHLHLFDATTNLRIT